MDTSGLQSATPRRYLFRRPKALHYFHNGQLKRENAGERQAGRFELFLDLLCEYCASLCMITMADGEIDVALVRRY